MVTDEEKLLWLFNQVHDDLSKGCKLSYIYDSAQNLVGVAINKDGRECWIASKIDLLIDYIILKNMP